MFDGHALVERGSGGKWVAAEGQEGEVGVQTFGEAEDLHEPLDERPLQSREYGGDLATGAKVSKVEIRWGAS